MAEVSNLLKRIDLLGKSMQEDSFENLEARRRELKTAVRKLGVALETPGETVDRFVYQPAGNVVIRIAVELGIFQILVRSRGTPLSSQELAKVTGADYVLLTRILRSLAAIDAVGEVAEESYVATAITRAFATSKGISGSRLFFDFLYPIWNALPSFLAQNKYQNPTDPLNSASQHGLKTDKHVFEFMGEDPTHLSDFNTFMSTQREGHQNWLDFYPADQQLGQGFTGGEDAVMVVDVGGAVGHELELIKSTYPTLPGRFILQDLTETIKKCHSNPVFEAMVHDFFTSQPIKGARAYYFRNVFHDWCDENCKKILRQTTAAMTKGYSKLLINEMVVPPKGASVIATESDLNVMAVVAGMERTEKQWYALLESVGLQITKIWTKAEDSESIIEAELKG